MQTLPEEELRSAKSLLGSARLIDQQQVLRLKNIVAQEFRDQQAYGAPTNEDETNLRKLAAQRASGARDNKSGRCHGDSKTLLKPLGVLGSINNKKQSVVTPAKELRVLVADVSYRDKE